MTATLLKHVAVKMLKVKISIRYLFVGTDLRATERHLLYGIAQCYLPPDTWGKRAPP